VDTWVLNLATGNGWELLDDGRPPAGDKSNDKFMLLLKQVGRQGARLQGLPPVCSCCWTCMPVLY
jgi:hypothetical protein